VDSSILNKWYTLYIQKRKMTIEQAFSTYIDAGGNDFILAGLSVVIVLSVFAPIFKYLS